MDKKRLEDFFARADAGLSQPAELLIYGSAAFILLDEEGRTSLDLDVAGLEVAPAVAHVPPGMIRDIGLPPFCRKRSKPVPRVAESR